MFFSLATFSAVVAFAAPKVGDAALGSIPYDKFEKDEVCAECHTDIARQYAQSMMKQSFTHAWDEIEYYELALPHAKKEPKVAGIEAGCNGCHAPLAFLAGDIPPKRPKEGTRANEGVSCDLCHSITGFVGEEAYNFNFISKPGKVKQGRRVGTESAHHEIASNPFTMSTELCGTCHNEKDPYGQWVKATQLEWKKSPQAKAGIVCQDCHMPPAAGNPAPGGDGKEHPDVRQHLFHGAHDSSKLAGSVEVQIHAGADTVGPGGTIELMATVVNAKAAHMIPSGSAEERVLWLHVEARDKRGKRYPLAVNAKGFEGEAMTIADPKALAYQDIGDIKGLKAFKGLPRDGDVPKGDRIFRLPYLDPKGRMTIAQWHTASFGPDYRLAPLEAKNETYTWKLPKKISTGPVTVTATVWYSRLVSSVAKYMKVPAAEYAPVKVADHTTTLTVKR
jgi:hypothetical protein